jgi:hypothetical protein
MSPSPPFRTKSEHVGAWHVVLHTPLAQEVSSVHGVVGGQPLHVPPQSTATSSPFWIWSEHEGIAQVNASQTPLEQSAASTQ